MIEPRVSILLVDDDPKNLQALEATLEPLGQDLVSIRSGKQALKCLLAQQFAVILLDVQMAGMDGFETARLARERHQSMHTPIIFLTAYSKNDEQISRAYRLGAVDYLLKPYVPEILRGKVKVFVELFRQGRQLQELSSAGTATSVTRELAGTGPICERAPARFAEIEAAYRKLVVDYLEQLLVRVKKPVEAMNRITGQIGDLGGGPRDLIDVHIHALDELVQSTGHARAHSLAVEGRLLAMEMMGLLVDYYRIGSRCS